MNNEDIRSVIPFYEKNGFLPLLAADNGEMTRLFYFDLADYKNSLIPEMFLIKVQLATSWNRRTTINKENMGKYTCQRPIHPGELLKEEIESRHMPQTRLAAQTGISYKILNDILNCRRPLTTSTAMLFEAALGISADLLMRMQLDYNMQQATRNKSHR